MSRPDNIQRNKSKEMRDKVSASWKDPILSEKRKRGTSIANKINSLGNTNRRGKKATLETREKLRISHLGKTYPRKKNPISSIKELVRKSLKYRQWRCDVFERDEYTCQSCIIKGGNIQADHIEPFSFIWNKYNIQTLEQAFACEELWNINNGRTLCRNCHKKTDTWGEKAKKYNI